MIFILILCTFKASEAAIALGKAEEHPGKIFNQFCLFIFLAPNLVQILFIRFSRAMLRSFDERNQNRGWEMALEKWLWTRHVRKMGNGIVL